MYTVVPKYPKSELDRDPYPLLDNGQNWGLTDEEFKLRFGGGKYAIQRRKIRLLNIIINDVKEKDELD